MLRILDGFKLVLQTPLQPADNAVSVSSADALKLNSLMAIGDTAYFVLEDGRGTEQMRYTHGAAIASPPGTLPLPVDRALLGTARRAWPIRSCLSTKPTEGVLNALICQRIAGGC